MTSTTSSNYHIFIKTTSKLTFKALLKWLSWLDYFKWFGKDNKNYLQTESRIKIEVCYWKLKYGTWQDARILPKIEVLKSLGLLIGSFAFNSS